MKPSLQLRISQNLTMTPQLQQAIRLLQLSNVELQTEVQEALESNMMLEIDEDDQDQDQQSGEKQNTDSESGINVNDIPEDLPVDSAWEDIYDGSSYYSSFSGYGYADNSMFENQEVSEKTLREHMLWQLNLTPTGDREKAIAITLVDSLDDAGYLTGTLEDILESLGNDMEVKLDEVEAMLHLLQTMDPPGVAARDLRECLLLQLEQSEIDSPWLEKAMELVDHHMQLMGARDYNQLARRLKVNREELQEIISVVRELNPRPGSQVQGGQTEYIVPDVYVKKEKGMWRVELNSETIPQLRVNRSYVNMIRKADNSSDNTSLKNHLQEAKWFIKSLQSRSETLLRVASAIVERQRAFLEHGDEAMKPLVLHDIAEVLGMHESTISRVTTRKYMHTPRGIYELKYFFSSHVGTDQGDTCSSTAIRAMIKKLISEEPSEKPLSDSKIAKSLSSQGINVARRTVAKYRETMSIPPSNERKRLI